MKTLTSPAKPGNPQNYIDTELAKQLDDFIDDANAEEKSGGPVIDFPTAAENKAHLAAMMEAMHTQREQHRLAAVIAIDSLPRLIEVMSHRTGQSYKLRRMLFSLWSGTPRGDLSDIVCFDWQIRIDLCRVLLGWGYEDKSLQFFYSALEKALADAGLREWFDEQREEK